MLLVVPPAHTNIPGAIATQCCLFWCNFQPWLMLPLPVPRMVACRWEDDEVQIVWAKAGRGIWGLGHVFVGKLYFTKILLMTVLSQGIESLNPFQNLKPSLLQSLPQRASMCNCSSRECRARSAAAMRTFECRQILRPYFWPLLTNFWFCIGVFFSFLCIWDVAHLNCHPLLPIFNHFYPLSIPHIELSPLWGPREGRGDVAIHSPRTLRNHLEERLLDQAQARASCTPLFWGLSRSIPQWGECLPGARPARYF